MLKISRKIYFLVGLTLCVSLNVCSQTVTSLSDGLWDDPTIWSSGMIPTADNASETIVDHGVVIPTAGLVEIERLVINGSLTVASAATLTIIPDALPGTWDMEVNGTFIMEDGAVLNGTSAANTYFESESRYVHLQGPLGFIPDATWNNNSTFEIAGFRTQGYINIAHSDSWKQTFGHVVYNCPAQTTAFVDLNGYLRNITGNFIIQNTNNHTLRLSTTQNPLISIGGDFIVEGNSRIWFSTTPASAVVNVQGDFRYLSTSNGISYFTTRGVIAVNVLGQFEMNSPGRIHMATTAVDSTGARQATISVHEDFAVHNGTMIAPPAPGKGRINFVGDGIQSVGSSSTGSSFQGNLDYLIESDATVSLGNAVLSNTSGTLTVRGKLQLGSSHPGGAIQMVNQGNLHISGERIFESGSTLEYNGVVAQCIGEGHPATPTVNLICSNPSGITLLKGLVVGDLDIVSHVNTQAFPINIGGDLSVAAGVNFNPQDIILVGGEEQHITAPGMIVRDLTINKSSNDVRLLEGLRISRSLAIESTNTHFYANGHLLLLSGSDEPSGTASVGPLPDGSAVIGDVTVQRHMAGEGRIYRFISSPVQHATVASMKDDFPVTGLFADPSAGPGIVSKSPSLYHYDESIGELQKGWLPYPTTGLASENFLVAGKGYAAFIRNSNTSTVWDVTGTLHQGPMDLPVAFTPNNEPSNGWNLVGNPYPSAIRWGETDPGKWTIENISSVIAVYDNSLVNGIYRYWDMDDSYAEISGGLIASGQSFWVRATGVNPKLTIREGVKVAGGATFYRREQVAISSFAISLTNGPITDVAYYKIRPTAKPTLDDWDGLKLDNELFDIAIVGNDEKSFAIHATNQMPCDSIIHLSLKDVAPGTYDLNIATRHDFSRYSFTLIDNYLSREMQLRPDQPFKLMVDNDPRSSASDRLAIRMTELPPASDIVIPDVLTACIEDVVKFNISGIEDGVTYSVLKGDMQLDAAKASGDTLQIQFSASALGAGEHILKFKAQSACHTVLLDAAVGLTIESAVHLHTDLVRGCPGDVVTLTAYSNNANAVISWFSEEHSEDTLARGSSIHTTPLYKSVVYYAEAFTEAGCTSARIPVPVNIKSYPPAEIILQGDSILQSNYDAGNSWYYNGGEITGATSAYLKLDQSGTYTLKVDTMGCILEVSYEYTILQSEVNRDASIFYPNPVGDVLYVANDRRDIEHLEIIDARGLTVRKLNTRASPNHRELEVDVRSLAGGVYWVMIVGKSKIKSFKLIKR